MNSYIINQSQGQTPEILLYGYIGNYQQNNSKSFVSDFKKLEASNKKINVRINSGGGDVFEGITIFNCLKNSTAEIQIFIDGLCASIASVIAMAGKTISMSKHSHFMAHRITGNVNGDPSQIVETANLMIELENSLIQIYSARTGISQEEIKNSWMITGKEKWLNSMECLELKLIDSIYDESLVEERNFATIYNKKNMENLNEFISFFNLKSDANAQDILASMQNQKNEIANLQSENEELKAENVKFQNQLKSEQENKVKVLVDNAIKDKKIQDNQKEVYISLATADFENTVKVLQSITPYKSISSQINNNSENHSELKTIIDWQKKNPQGLFNMMKNDPEKYALLYEQQYGAKPQVN